jgi:hypothetical protein
MHDSLQLRKAGFTEKSNPKVIVKVGSKEQPMGTSTTIGLGRPGCFVPLRVARVQA